MNTVNDTSGQAALTIKQTASALGLHEFSVFSRIQADDLAATRFPSGIVAIPVSELERLSKLSIHLLSIPPDEPGKIPSDRVLGIGNKTLGMGLKGEPACYTVPDHFRMLTATEIQGYRAAFGAIWDEYTELNRIRKGLEKSSATSSEKEIQTSRLGVWQVQSALLNLGQSDVLLCRKQGRFAVIEWFRAESLYAKANGRAEILLEGADARKLAAEFADHARHTLEYMASDHVARAQKVIWEQYPDNRPGKLVATISERCRLAAVPEERITEEPRHTQSRSIRM